MPQMCNSRKLKEKYQRMLFPKLRMRKNLKGSVQNEASFIYHIFPMDFTRLVLLLFLLNARPLK